MGYPDGGAGWIRPSGPADVPPASGRPILDPGTDPRVAAIVHLLHRRRGWAWTLGGSLVALVAFVAIGTNFWPNATGAVGVISGSTVILLLAVVGVALTAVITDTVRLRRREPSIRAHATSRTSHHPVTAHPFRTPVHHRTSRLFAWVTLVSFPLLTVLILPDQVNAVAYLAGAGKTGTFLPQSYELVCSRFPPCETWTDGVLQTNPPVTATWTNRVPLGQPFRVRQPVWNGWGHPDLMNAGAAASAITAVLFGELVTVFVGVGLVRGRLRRRREAASMTATAL